MNPTRIAGITVLPEYIQNESIDGVLESIVSVAGVNAVSISPYVMAPADAGSGTREPPADGSAGSARLLDRPLWGRRELFVRTSPSFVPDRSLYAGLRYQPPEPDDLTASEGQIVAEFIKAAKRRGLKVYHQVQAAIPPGYRVQFGGPDVDDIPLLPDGNSPVGRVDNNASLASPEIRAYSAAMARDLMQAYPEIDGLRIDWPEYPPYTFDSLFFDFNAHAEAAAGRLGFDFERMRADALRIRKALFECLSNDFLERVTLTCLRDRLVDFPGFQDLLRFKATLATEMVAVFRQAMTEAGGDEKELFPAIFPEPWSFASGADVGRFSQYCSAIGVKFYTMHWPMMIRLYADALLAERPDLDTRAIMNALARLFEMTDEAIGPRDDYAYTKPDEIHPVGSEAIKAKLRSVMVKADDLPIVPIAHGYGPPADFRRRFEAAFEAGNGSFWINRYGYLTDEKLDIVGRISRRSE